MIFVFPYSLLTTRHSLLHRLYQTLWRCDAPSFLRIVRFAMPIVKFVKENKEIEVPPGANLRSEAIKAGVNLNQGVLGFGQNLFKYANCLGMGMCGTCAVLINRGMENTNPMTKREWLKFKSP